MRKRDVIRPYPPDFVSAETLAYRLDISRSALDERVDRGDLPRPYDLGGVPRYFWAEVEMSIRNSNKLANSPRDTALSELDPYLEGLERVETENA